MERRFVEMKYEAPMFKKAELEVKDIITASGDVTVNETSETSADYSINFSKLFGGKLY